MQARLQASVAICPPGVGFLHTVGNHKAGWWLSRQTCRQVSDKRSFGCTVNVDWSQLAWLDLESCPDELRARFQGLACTSSSPIRIIVPHITCPRGCGIPQHPCMYQIATKSVSLLVAPYSNRIQCGIPLVCNIFSSIQATGQDTFAAQQLCKATP